MDSKYYKQHTFSKHNLYILLVSLLFIVAGYILMAGGTSEDGVTFNPEVFSFTRIKVAPVLCTLGYFGVLVAILWRSSGQHQTEEDGRQ